MPYFDEEIRNDSGNPIPVSATALPLPTGATTAAKQDAAKAVLDTIFGAVDGLEALLTSVRDNTDTLEVTIGNVDVNTDELEARVGDLTATPVATSLLGRVKNMQALLTSLDGKNYATQTTLAAAKTVLDNILLAVDQLEGYTDGVEAKLDVLHADLTAGLPSDVSDRVGRLLGHVTVDSTVLPTGAATSAKQDTGNTSLASIDSKLANPLPVTGPLTDAQLRAAAVPVSAATLPLPTGAATSANQISANTKLDTLHTDLGLQAKLTDTQPVSAASLPLPAGAATEASLASAVTALTNISGFTDGVEGLLTTIRDNADTVEALLTSLGGYTDGVEGLLTTIRDNADQLEGYTDGIEALLTTIAGKDFATQTTLAATLAAINLQAKLTDTQPVSAASLPLPAGAATSANQTSANTKLDTLHTDIGLQAKLTDTQPVSAAALPLPSGAATAANQATANASLASIDGKLANPLPVTGPLTDAQLRAAAVPVSNASLPLPAGASTAAKQDTGNTSVASIDTKTPALGQALAAASSPVVLTAIQQAALTPPAAITNFANETGGHLAAIDTAQGAQADAESAGNGSVIAILKRIRTLLGSVLSVSITPQTSGGLSVYENINLINTGVEVKASAGQVYGWFIYNNANQTRYVKLYNTYAGATPASTDTPSMVLAIPGGAAANVEYGNGIAFGTKIGIRATTGVANNDNGAPTANDVVANLMYK